MFKHVFMPHEPPARSNTRRDFLVGASALALSACTKGADAMTTPKTSSMPQSARAGGVAFVAHGAPTLAIDAVKGAAFADWGASLAKPRAILMVSAHYEASPAVLSSSSTLPLIYDFSGFPRALYEVKYPAPGAPFVVDLVRGALGTDVRVDERRGLDHGSWTPLVHMFPLADVPVIQLSLPTITDDRALFSLGEKLAPVVDEGVLVMGSGNLTHNLRRVIFDENADVADWANEFDVWVKDALVRFDVDTLIDWRERAPAARLAHPREEHWAPILVMLGAAHAAGHTRATFPVEGFEYGTLTRRSVQFALT
jgi:4,5-DOPA dioxygenase extradiol